MTVDEILEFAYKASSEPSSAQSPARVLIKFSFDKLREGDKQSLCDFYARLDPSRLSLMLMICAIRQCFGYREMLPEWWSFKDRAIENAKIRFPDSWQKSFVGLLDPEKEHKGIPGASRALDQMIGIHPSLQRND